MEALNITTLPSPAGQPPRPSRHELWLIWRVLESAALLYAKDWHDPLTPEVPVVADVLVGLMRRVGLDMREGAVRTTSIIDRLSLDEALVLVTFRDALLDGAACGERDQEAHQLGLDLDTILEFLFFGDITDADLARFHSHVNERNADLEAAMQAAIAEGRLR